jgi:hypothetical protein
MDTLTISKNKQNGINLGNRDSFSTDIVDMYSQSYDYNNLQNISDLNNKLFCTFTTESGIEALVEDLSSRYNIMYNKMFVLRILNSDEFVITYNVDQGNVSSIPENTILVHRKKDSNTLYTINALNELIKALNGGVVDSRYRVNWQHYRNTILLTQQSELKQLKTKIHQILEV